jgi:cell fate regulator YaaT (PSP1 superfamily)
MKQIGARQEAGRIGGIGPCGRELCCSGWISSFVSVSTGAARIQDISLNPQKLAGQCAKLKCCLNYEIDAYVEAQRQYPAREIPLETRDNTYYHFKTDVFKNQMTYSTDKNFAANTVTISSQRAYEVINMNKKGHKPHHLQPDENESKSSKEYRDILDESVSRFDHLRKKKNKKPHPNNGNFRNQRPYPGTPENMN